MRRASRSNSRAPVARALRADARRLPRDAQRDGRDRRAAVAAEPICGIGTDEAAWVIDAYNLVGASLLLSAGFLADRFGRKRMLCTGYALFTDRRVRRARWRPSGDVADRRSACCRRSAARRSRRRASRSSPTSIPSRASAPARSASGASPRASAPGSGRSSAGRSPSGWAGARCSSSTRSQASIALVIVLRVVPRSRSAVARRIDVAGQLLVTGFLATLTYALIEAPRYGFGSTAHRRRVRARGRRCSSRSSSSSCGSPSRWSISASSATASSPARSSCAVATFFTFGGFIYFNALYLQDIRGYSALAAGVLTLPAAVPALIGGPLSGYLVGTRGPRGVLVGGMLVLGAGVGSLALLAEDAALGWLLAAYLVVGHRLRGAERTGQHRGRREHAARPGGRGGRARELRPQRRRRLRHRRARRDRERARARRCSRRERRVRCGALGVPGRCTSMRSTRLRRGGRRRARRGRRGGSDDAADTARCERSCGVKSRHIARTRYRYALRGIRSAHGAADAEGAG